MTFHAHIGKRVPDRRRTLLRLALLCAALASSSALYGGIGASTAVAADCNHTVFDAGGYKYDFEATIGTPPGIHDHYGEPSDGGSNGPADTPPGPVSTVDAWDDWGDAFVFSSGADVTTPTAADKYRGPEQACAFGLNGQEIAYPVVPMHGLEVQHRWFVDPGLLHGARILTVLHNPGAAPVSVSVVQGDPSGFGNLGSDDATASRATSDGTKAFSPASSWGVTSDNSTVDEDPALAHVWDGIGGAIRVAEVVLEKDTLYWDWKNVAVAPGATVAFISYEIVDADPSAATATEVAQAAAQAQARVTQPFSSLYAGMSAAEIAGTLNWPHPLPTATAIAAVKKANAATPVNLTGSASTAIPGLPQCAGTFAWKTDDGATGTAATLPHVFAAGNHHATLTVTNSCGGSQSAEVSFKVARAFALGKVKLDRKAGAAKLAVKVFGPGTLTLAGRGVKKQTQKVKKAGNVALTMKLTGKARAALAHAGRAKVKVTVALTPVGGRAESQSKVLVLKARR